MIVPVLRRGEYFECCVSPVIYSNSVRIRIHAFKFRAKPYLAEGFGEAIADSIKTQYSNIEFDVCTYAPIGKKSLKKRGYNQAKLLALQVSKRLDLPCEELVLKVKQTETQVSVKNFHNRRKNLDHSMAGIKCSHKNILLIDDVITTGSTLDECARAIMAKNRSARVFCATIANTER